MKHVFLASYLTGSFAWLSVVVFLAINRNLDLASAIAGIGIVGLNVLAVAYVISRKVTQIGVNKGRMTVSIALYLLSAVLFVIPLFGFDFSEIDLIRLGLLVAGTAGVGLSLHKTTTGSATSDGS